MTVTRPAPTFCTNISFAGSVRRFRRRRQDDHSRQLWRKPNITLRWVAQDPVSMLSYAPDGPRIASVLLFSQEMTARAEQRTSPG